MIHGIIDTINTNISADWIDIKGGLSKTVEKEFKTKGGIVNKRFPVWINSDKSTCINDDYLTAELKRRGAIIFWRELSNNAEPMDFGGSMITYNLELVVWVNHKILDKTQTNSDYVKAAIEYAMPSRVTHSSMHVGIEFQGYTENPMNNYDYDEAKLQYSTYPYECFGLSYEVFYYSNSKCESTLTNDPTRCF